MFIFKMNPAPPLHANVPRLPTDPMRIFRMCTPDMRVTFGASPAQLQAVARENRSPTTTIDQVVMLGDSIHKHAVGRLVIPESYQTSVHDAFAEANWYGYYTIRDHVFTADILRSPHEYSKYHKHVRRFVAHMKLPAVLHPIGVDDIDLIPENMDVLTDAPLEYITEHVF